MQVSLLAVAVTAIGTIVTAAVGAWSWRRRHRIAAARPFAALLAAQTAWTAGHLAETLARTRDGKLVWDSLQNLPFAVMGPAYLLLGARFAQVRAPRRLLAAVTAVGGAAALALATTPLHGLLRGDAHLEGTPAVLLYALTGWDLALAIVAVASLVVAAALVMRRSASTSRAHARQSVTLAFAFAVPPMATMLGWSFDIHIDGDRDVTPLAFTMGALIAGWGLLRHQLFSLAPVAHDAVVARLPDPIVVTDLDQIVVDANPAALELLNAEERDVLGHPAAEVLARLPALAAVIDGGPPAELCHAGQRGVRWYEASVDVLHDPIGRVAGSILIVRDITTRKQSAAQLERALASSEERFRALFDQMQELTGILDRDGRLIAANRASLEMVGKTEAELIGTPFWDTPWWQPHQRAQVRDAVTRAAAGEMVRFLAEHVDVHGRVRRIDFSLTPVRDPDGRVIELIPEGRDVTDLEQRTRAEAIAASGADPSILVIRDHEA
jgi:PAS domain S-box-containing protein